MRKIIFINRFFYPDHSATAQILTDLVINLRHDNKEVHVVTSRMLYDQPNALLSDEEIFNNVRIHRCMTTRFGRSNLLGRSMDYLSFYVTSFFKLLMIASKDDVLVVKTDPPMISIIVLVVSIIKQCHMINWVQDMFPEIAKELGVKYFDGFLYVLIKKLRNWSFKKAKYNVAIGQIMFDRISKNTYPIKNTKIIHNWVVGKEMKPVDRVENYLIDDWKLRDKFIVGYSGNLGRAHDLETLFNTIKNLEKDKEIVFVFIGGGAGYDEIKSRVEEQKLTNVLFKPYQDSDVLSFSLSLPDVHIVSLNPKLEGLIVPSKIYGILSVGRPIIFVGGEISEVNDIVSKANCGDFVNIGDNEALSLKIRELKENNELKNNYSLNSHRVFNEKFMPQVALQQWEKLLNELC